MTSFATLDLIEPLLRAVAAENYAAMTPIQEQAIPPLLAGRDVLGCAQTGTGKTAAFLLPILQHLTNKPRRGKAVIRGLVLTPTRELASQIGDSFAAYGKFLELRHLVIFGGVKQRPQVAALRRGVDVLVATPGRLLDLHGQGLIDLGHVEFFVLDEADRMLDMGFIRDVRRILSFLPDERQNLLFSATMPASIVKLAGGFLHEPVRVEVDPQSTTVERIEQRVLFVARRDKPRLLRDVLRDPEIESAIVFTRTKHGANKVTQDLSRAGELAAAIHGNKSQGARERALAAFKAGEMRVLVATDIASRGIDIDGVSHVINYDLPNIPESYVHRIGRTARAGRDGIAIALCDETEGEFLRDIEKLTDKPLDRVLDHDWHYADAMPSAAPPRGGSRRKTVAAGGGPARQERSARPGSGPSPSRRRAGAGRTPPDDAAAGPSADGPPKRKRRRRRSGRGTDASTTAAPAQGATPAQTSSSPAVNAPRAARPAGGAETSATQAGGSGNGELQRRKRRRRRMGPGPGSSGDS